MREVSVNDRYGRKSVLSLRNLTCYVVAITILLSIGPFFAWSSFAGGIGVTVFKLLQMLAIMLMLIQLPIRHMQLRELLCGLAILGIYFFYCLFTGVKSGTTHPFLLGNILVYVFYALTAMTDHDILLKSYKLFRTVFAVVLGYTLIIHILILIGIPIPYTVLQSGEAGRLAAGRQIYQNYLGCILVNENGRLLYRFTSVFTEPGVVGTFCAFFLAAGNFDVVKNKHDRIFLISGILSLSAAFYVMTIIIYAMKSLRKGGYKLFGGLAIILVVYFVFINIDFSNPMLTLLQERLTITETGLAGDNRIKAAAEAEYQAFLNGDLKTVLLGYGYPIADPQTGLTAWQTSATYKESIYCLGFIGYGLMIAWFIVTPLVCYKSKKPQNNYLMYSYMAIFILSQYQRPYMKSLFLVYVLLAGCLYSQQCVIEVDKS